MDGSKPFPVKKSSVFLTVLFAILTYGIYCSTWFLRRRDALNTISPSRSLGVKVFVWCIILNAFQLILDVAYVAQTFSLIIGLSIWVVWLIQCFKIRRILEEYISENQDVPHSISGLATVIFGIFYLQYEINKLHDPEKKKGIYQETVSPIDDINQTNIHRGRPVLIFDAIGNIFSILEKIIFLNWRVDNHKISKDTEDYMSRFIERHHLHDVTVRLNQYAPIEELLCLKKNKSVNPLIRYPFGGMFMLFYTFQPMRLFGGDCYNPSANTVHVFSDHIAIALHELGHALDFKKRRFPGLYSLLRYIPGVALYQEYKATKYALDFFREVGDKENEVAAYKILFPAYSTYVFGFFSDVFPVIMSITMLPFVAIGHIAGRLKASRIKKEYETSSNDSAFVAELN